MTRSVSAATILRSFAVASLPPLSPAATTTSPVGANAMVSSAAPVPERLEGGLDGLGLADDLLGARGALGLELALGRRERRRAARRAGG